MLLDWPAKVREMSATSLKKGHEGDAPHDERRKKLRFPLRCPLTLHKQGELPDVSGVTVNISSLGFYGIVDHRFQPGENLRCTVRLPADTPALTVTKIKLLCEVVVLRVEEQPNGQFGLACQINNYNFVRPGSWE